MKGKVIVITGASSGIGKETALLLATMGARVALLDIDETKGKDLRNKIGDTAVFIRCDVSKEADCKIAVEEIINHYSRIDVLFNNAGAVIRKDAASLELKEWDLVLDSCLKGTYLMSKFCLPDMIKRKSGIIVNTGSGWSLKGGEMAAAYCAAKAGILNLTRSMAIDYGKYNIRVNCVCPGDIKTPMLENERLQLGINEEEFYADAANRPLRRVGTPKDVALAVLFLCSGMSEWVSGTSLVVDGGGIA